MDLYNHYEGDEERCGFILFGGVIIELPNVHPEPINGFEIDPKAILRYIDQIEGIWHTHPKGSSTLSGEDKLCMEQWPQLDHYIVGEDGVSVYKVTEGVVINADYFPR